MKRVAFALALAALTMLFTAPVIFADDGGEYAPTTDQSNIVPADTLMADDGDFTAPEPIVEPILMADDGDYAPTDQSDVTAMGTLVADSGEYAPQTPIEASSIV